MLLEDFVSQTIINVVNGITKAQFETKGSGALINPKNVELTSKTSAMYHDGLGAIVENIEFDVAISLTEGKENNGKIGVVASIISLGGERKTLSTDQQVNKIRFSVPIIFPTSEAQKAPGPSIRSTSI